MPLALIDSFLSILLGPGNGCLQLYLLGAKHRRCGGTYCFRSRSYYYYYYYYYSSLFRLGVYGSP